MCPITVGLMLAMAHQGYTPKFLNSLKYTDVVGILAKSAPVLSKAYNSSADTNFSLGLSDFQTRSKDWQKMIAPDPNNKAKQIPYWDHFRNVYLVPIVAPKTALIVPKATTPVTPAPPVKNKKSDKDFEIEFTDPNNEFDFIYGIVVCNSNAAYFENNGSITELLVFKAFTIL